MTFWLNVGLAYLLLLGAGTLLGAFLGARDRRGGRGDGGGSAPVAPEPVGPTLARDCPPLGSDFDRALLPRAFADEETSLAHR